MEKEFKEYFEKMLISTIHRQSTIIAVETLKSNKKYDQSFLGWLIGITLLITVSVYFSIWWLFIPTVVCYTIYDYIRKFKYVRKQLPKIMDTIIRDSLNTMTENLKDDVEDLEIKSKGNIYNEKDIKEKESGIEMLRVSINVLQELQADIKLEL